MEIRVQVTPNPNALKFILPEPYFSRPMSFPGPEEAAGHPLAAQLFALGDIYNVFMVQDFITVNKLPDTPWEPLREEVKRTIVGYFAELQITD